MQPTLETTDRETGEPVGQRGVWSCPSQQRISKGKNTFNKAPLAFIQKGIRWDFPGGPDLELILSLSRVQVQSLSGS